MKNTIKGLIKKECANFNSENCYCYPMDSKCRFYEDQQFTDENIVIPVRCKYFEKSVLPIDPALEFTYRNERKLGFDPNIIKCEDCKKLFRRKSNCQTRCDLCQSIVTRDKTRERVYKSRGL